MKRSMVVKGIGVFYEGNDIVHRACHVAYKRASFVPTNLYVHV